MTAAGKRILVVEDDYFIAKGLRRDLAAMGFAVVGPASSIADALALIAVEPLDGALLDVNLRGEEAFPVADMLAERGVPFVFATGYGAETIPERHRAAPRCEKPMRAAPSVAALFKAG